MLQKYVKKLNYTNKRLKNHNFCIFSLKNLRMSKKSSNFAVPFEKSGVMDRGVEQW